MILANLPDGDEAKTSIMPERARAGDFARLPKHPVSLKTNADLEFVVRPARPDDRQGMAFLLTHMAPEDMRFRFLTPAHRISSDVLEMMTKFDPERVQNLLAVDRDTHIPIASALLAADDAMEELEIAMAVQAHYKDKGVSWTLLDHVINCARQMGFNRLLSVELREHAAAIRLEREMGFSISSFPGDPTLTLLELDLQKTEVSERNILKQVE